MFLTQGGRNHLEQLHGEGGLLIGSSRIQMGQRYYQEHRLDREKAQEVLRNRLFQEQKIQIVSGRGERNSLAW